MSGHLYMGERASDDDDLYRWMSKQQEYSQKKGGGATQGLGGGLGRHDSVIRRLVTETSIDGVSQDGWGTLSCNDVQGVFRQALGKKDRGRGYTEYANVSALRKLKF